MPSRKGPPRKPGSKSGSRGDEPSNNTTEPIDIGVEKSKKPRVRPMQPVIPRKPREANAKEARNPRAVIGHNKPPAKSFAGRLDQIAAVLKTSTALHNVVLRQSVAEACAIAQAIRGGGPGAWHGFINEPRWSNVKNPPDSRDRVDVLHYVFRWIFGMSGDAAKDASFYRRAVEPLLDEGIEIDDLPAEIVARGGFKKLAAERADTARAVSDSADEASASDEPPKRRPALSGSIARPKPPTPPLQDDDVVDFDDDNYIDPPERPVPSFPSNRGIQVKFERCLDGMLDAILSGNTRAVLRLPSGRPIILRGQIRFEGPVCHIAVTDASLDQDND